MELEGVGVIVPEPDGDIVVRVYLAGCEAPTLTTNSWDWMIWFDCPTTVILYVPGDKPLDTSRRIPETNPAWPEAGEKDTDSP